ncbi:MAG: N-acetylmuramoyl-L-alanine amidase [Bacteroidota bacterium]
MWQTLHFVLVLMVVLLPGTHASNFSDVGEATAVFDAPTPRVPVQVFANCHDHQAFAKCRKCSNFSPKNAPDVQLVSPASHSCFPSHPQPAPGLAHSPTALRTIVIDPGHGGRDNGCSGRHSKEKHIALSVAKKLGSQIKAAYPELTIIYTRTTDRFVPLHRRARLANDKKADLFISLHCNAIRKAPHVHGSETYVMGLHTASENLEVTKRENASVLLEEVQSDLYADFDPDSPEGHILLSSYQNAYLDQSILLATEIEKQIKNHALGSSHGVKQAGFHVLRMTAMPSVLVEMGFLTNSRDESFMRSTKGQEKMATALFTAFSNYKYELERNNTLPMADNNTTPERTKAVITQPAPTRSAAPAGATAAIEYKIQLGSFSKPIDINQGKWLKVDYIIEELEEEGRFRYFATALKDLAKAQMVKRELRQLGFRDAFIVAYRGRQRVPVQDLQEKGPVGY